MEEGKQEKEKEQNFIEVNVGLLVLDQCIDQYSVLGAAKLTLQADITHLVSQVTKHSYVYSSCVLLA